MALLTMVREDLTRQLNQIDECGVVECENTSSASSGADIVWVVWDRRGFGNNG